jgi:hypothetical protein
MPFETSQGIEFKFNSVAYTATSLSVSKSMGEFNVTSLNIPAGAGCLTRFRPGGLKNLEIKVDWVGPTRPPTDKQYDIEFAGSGPGSGQGLTGESLASPVQAIATGVTLTAQAGELIKGTATFKISVD